MKPAVKIEDGTRPPLTREVRGPKWFENLAPKIQARIAAWVLLGWPVLLLGWVGILHLSKPTEASRKKDALEKRVQQLSEQEWLLLLPELDMTLAEVREAFHIKSDMDIGEALMRERIYTFEQLKQSFQVRFFINSRTPNAIPIVSVMWADGSQHLAIQVTHENGEITFLDFQTRQPIMWARRIVEGDKQ